MRHVPRRRRLLLAFFAAVLGLTVAVGLVELALRMFDPLGLRYEVEFTRYRTQALQFAWDVRPPAELDLDGRLYWHKPNLDLDLGSFRLRTNQHGCRGPEIAVPKPAEVFRIVLLGDSVAFGWGVDDEVTFARRLEREWYAAHPRRRLEVVNTALPMYDTNQEEATLRELGLSLQPDLVLLVYVVNDIEPTRDVVEQTLRGVDPHPEEDLSIPDDFWSWAGARIGALLPACGKLVALRSDLTARMARRLPPSESYRPERFGKGPRGWPRSQAALLRIAALCREAKVPFVVFDHTLPRLEPLPPFCREHGIECVPLWFSAEDHRLGIVNSPLDTHANARGHELLLERLVAALRDRRLLPE